MQHILRRYLSNGHITARALGERSGIHEGTVSRYLSGQRMPKPGSEQVERLARALYELLEEQGAAGSATPQEIAENLNKAIVKEHQKANKSLAADNLRKLLVWMEVTTHDYAKQIHYSASGVSRILNGENTPGDVEDFVRQTVEFVRNRYGARAKYVNLRSFLEGETGIRPRDISQACDLLGRWLTGEFMAREDDFSTFLTQIDAFDYETYVSAADRKAVADIPTFRWKLPVTRKYTGLSGLDEGIRDFLKATVTSASTEDIFLFSDHPIEHLANQPETAEEWKKLLGAAILQGKRVQIIETINRPEKEMLIGLANWIPLYMTGHIRSYYMERAYDPVFRHVVMVSGSAVLTGFAAGDLNEGTYTFSKSMSKIAEGRNLADNMLRESRELISVFDDDATYEKYKNNQAKVPATRICYSDQLPWFTLSEDLAAKMAQSSGLSKQETNQVMTMLAAEKQRLDTVLGHSRVSLLVPKDTRKETEKGPLIYTPADYQEHWDLTQTFADNHQHFTLLSTDEARFRNLTVEAREDMDVIISRRAGTNLHFLIKHPSLVDAIWRVLTSIMRAST